MKLRPYQNEACEAAKTWMRQSIEPCLIDAAPAAGKSFMIAALAHWLHDISGGKRVLCLAPSAELVKQNHEKYLMTGERASIYSASAGGKSTRHFVVFGTPGTVKNAISRFKTAYAGVIVDECHGITPTIKAIIEAMREGNPNLRVLGLSGTPFRLGSGYVFRMWPDDKVNDDGKAREPYFTKCVYRVSAREMLDAGFITPMQIGAINAGGYDTSAIRVLPNGHADSGDVERAFEGHGRETAAIVSDVIEQARMRSGGVMYFAATVRHAEEVMASLPPSMSALVTGDTPKADRNRIIAAYRKREIRHLVSVGALTTGFDVSHTETIAILRFTESAALLQQIMGRAWRLDDAKEDSLLLDYAGNVERHFPDGDIYSPVIKASGGGESGGCLEAECPDCGHANEFSAHKDFLDFQKDKHGYCLDVFGEPVMSEYGPVSGHYGRRCFGMIKVGPKGEYDRCGYYWTSKDCPACQEKNDIAARFCRSCKAELINPNEKLIADFKALKKDPTQVQTDQVLSMSLRDGVSSRGNRTVRADFVTPYRQFSVWFTPDANAQVAQRKWARFQAALDDGDPHSVTYKKDAETGFFDILAYNQPIDEAPEVLGKWGALDIRQARRSAKDQRKDAA